MTPVRPVNASFVEARHLVVHSFPLPSTGERRRRSVRNGPDHGEEPRCYGAPVQISTSRNSLAGVIVWVSPKEVNKPRAR